MLCRSCYHRIPHGSLFCPRCGARQEPPASAVPGPGDAPTLSPSPGAAPGRTDNPWEQREGRGVLAAFGETLQRSLFHPAEFFRGTAPDRGLGAALGYAVIVGTVGFAVGLLWQAALGRQFGWWEGGERFMPAMHPNLRAVGILFLPFGIAVGNAVWAAVLHVALLILGGARSGYGATLKAVCYSASGAAFNVFPVCGAAVGAVWQAVLVIVGMRELHRTTSARAFWAWFLPFLVALCLAALAGLAMVLGLAKVWHHFGGPIDL